MDGLLLVENDTTPLFDLPGVFAKKSASIFGTPTPVFRTEGRVAGSYKANHKRPEGEGGRNEHCFLQ